MTWKPRWRPSSPASARRSIFIRHRDSGGGGPPRRGGGGGAGFDVARKLPSCVDIKLGRFLSSKRSSSAAVIRLQRKRSSASGAPSTTVRSLRELQWSPSPASRGRMVQAISFSRYIRIRVLPTKATNLLPPKKGEAERRKGATVPWGLATHRMLPPQCASGTAARPAGRARLSALHRGACLGHVPKLDPGRASRDAVRRR
jgi:hypothetical protein